MARYLTIEKFSIETGYSPDAIRTKIRDGIWREGREYKKAPDNRILMDMEGYEKWVETGGVLKRPRTVVSKSRSCIKASDAGSGFPLSPLPLT